MPIMPKSVKYATMVLFSFLCVKFAFDGDWVRSVIELGCTGLIVWGLNEGMTLYSLLGYFEWFRKKTKGYWANTDGVWRR